MALAMRAGSRASEHEPGPHRRLVRIQQCMAQLSLAAAPKRLARGAGRYPQPVALLARLAVDSEHEGRGLGAALLQDVLLRTAAISERIGCRALLVHAESEAAKRFYQHLVPEFESSPTDPLHLVLLVKDIVRSLGGGGS